MLGSSSRVVENFTKVTRFSRLSTDARAQGNCTGAPSKGAPAGLKPRQCVLDATLGVFAWYRKPANAEVWLDNLYIRASSSSNASTLVFWGPATTSLARLWMTNTALVGAAQNFYTTSGPAYAVGARPPWDAEPDLGVAHGLF
jgi:hypothetical protein